MSDKANIGVSGLAVMGRNLARNLARHGHTVAVHSRTEPACAVEPRLPTLLTSGDFAAAVADAQQSWRAVVATATKLGIPAPGFTTAMAPFTPPGPIPPARSARCDSQVADRRAAYHHHAVEQDG